MHVLVVGQGGREHALAWKASLSPLVDHVYVAPGNAGTATMTGVSNIAIDVMNFEALIDFAKEMSIGLTIIGPEAPLVGGIVDAFKIAGLPCFGPTKAAAQLEGSKDYCKQFLLEHGIPTAASCTFTDVSTALSYIEGRSFPLVIKADGLAAGKGVVIAEDLQTATAALTDMLDKKQFGTAGARVVIEDFLVGEEASFIVMSDGVNILPMATSQDHKARDEGDRGPNTGGMGAYSPAPIITPERFDLVMKTVIKPTIEGMAAKGAPFVGFLYAGLMISPTGELNVLEYNVRFGDPETQPIMMRLDSDLVAHCLAALNGTLNHERASWSSDAAIGVVIASGGYPGSYKSGLEILGLDSDFPENCQVFHSGTELVGQQTLTAGGRVLCVCARAPELAEAQAKVYQGCEMIQWPASFYRRDIGFKALLNTEKDM